jgi:ubiquinone/menaquinone biosynthesis C-methylase UbiE
VAADQQAIDVANSSFWDELCGTSLAQSVGIADSSAAELERFDGAYLSFYPYLQGYLSPVAPNSSVLEIGTGYGTVGRLLLAHGAVYSALDIAAGPIEMARLSLARAGQPTTQAVQGSALSVPFDEESFDHVVAIGSLHHTGNLPKALSEVHRVLKRGGRALVMVYNRNSLNRRVTTPLARTAAKVFPGKQRWILTRTEYDLDTEGTPAPHTDFVSPSQLRSLCSQFRSVEIRQENANAVSAFGHAIIPRSLLLSNLGHVAGLDLYAQLLK